MQQNVGNAKRMHMYADALNVCAPYAAVVLSSPVPPPGEREIISTKITGSEPTILYLISLTMIFMPMILQWNIRGLQANREELDMLSSNLDPTVICKRRLKAFLCHQAYTVQ